MVDLLIQYARAHQFVLEPGLKPKEVKWAIVFNNAGDFLEVIPLGDTGLGKKNRGQTFAACPHLEQPEMIAGGAGCRHFLVDTCEVVALLGAEPSNNKAEAKHDYFVNLLVQASSIMPELKLVANALHDRNVLTQIQERLSRLSAKPPDSATFRIGNAYPVESKAWHDWWRDFRRQLNAKRDKAKGSEYICFATGEEVTPEATHPKIQVSDVGGQSSGSVLIGFDKDAFESYGLSQSANAAMSAESAKAYADSLNSLLKNHSQRLVGAKVVHWFSHKVPKEDDPLAWLDGGSAEQQELSAKQRAHQLLNRIRTGERADLADNYFYALTVSGSGGRVMVRDWMMGQFESLVESVEQWFYDLSIVRYDGSGLTREPGIQQVITCLLPPRAPSQKESDWMKPVGSARLQLWKAALNRQMPIPFSVMARIITVHLPFMLNGDDAQQTNLLQRRMGLLKAYHNRKSQGGESMKPYLNEDHPDPAYHCGRLMAILARLQYAALGDVGAGVVQRYYAAASVTPALILGRLTRTGQFHLNKLDPGLAHWYESKIALVWGRIKDQIPRVLDLEQQSLFALGYYQQMAADRAGQSDKQPPQEEDSNNGRND
jgi:CRISPR-associated protein Csd1